MDKEASSGKPGVASGNGEAQEEEQWGEQGDWQWEDIDEVSGGMSKEKARGRATERVRTEAREAKELVKVPRW